MRHFLAPTLLILSAAGCGSDTIECGTPPDLTGSWDYSAVQTNPAASITGTLTITSGGSCIIEGSIAVTIDDGDGSPTMPEGGISGLFLSESAVDFIADLDGARRHIGSVVADTVAGSWSQPSGMSTVGGTFKAIRSAP